MLFFKKIKPLFFALIFGLSACGDKPSAPFTNESAEQIINSFDVTGMQADTAKLGSGSPKAIGVISRYLADAFDDAGYSLDETLFTYFTEANMATIQMHIFAQRTQMGVIILGFSRGEDYEEEILNSGAMSERTAEFLRNKK